MPRRSPRPRADALAAVSDVDPKDLERFARLVQGEVFSGKADFGAAGTATAGAFSGNNSGNGDGFASVASAGGGTPPGTPWLFPRSQAHK
jgi:hypothetical protein